MRRHFIEGDVQMANKHTRSCSTSSANRPTEIKHTMTYHYTPLRRTKIKNRGDTKSCRGSGETVTFLVGLKNGAATLENSLAVS